MTTDLTHQIHSLIDEGLFPLHQSVTEDSDLFAEGLDSLALMQLIVFLEKEFSINISPEDLDRKNFSTLANIANMVRNKASLP
jgi:methoxymalonate biosynthesis acyl carrier protein